MRRLQAIPWIMTVCTDLRLSQTKTLAQLGYRPGFWCSSNDAKQCNAFTIGRAVRNRLRVTAAAAIRAVTKAITEAAPNCG